MPKRNPVSLLVQQPSLRRIRVLTAGTESSGDFVSRFGQNFDEIAIVETAVSVTDEITVRPSSPVVRVLCAERFELHTELHGADFVHRLLELRKHEIDEPLLIFC